jgi:hypothetical protein
MMLGKFAVESASNGKNHEAASLIILFYSIEKTMFFGILQPLRRLSLSLMPPVFDRRALTEMPVVRASAKRT